VGGVNIKRHTQEILNFKTFCQIFNRKSENVYLHSTMYIKQKSLKSVKSQNTQNMYLWSKIINNGNETLLFTLYIKNILSYLAKYSLEYPYYFLSIFPIYLTTRRTFVCSIAACTMQCVFVSKCVSVCHRRIFSF